MQDLIKYNMPLYKIHIFLKDVAYRVHHYCHMWMAETYTH